MAKIPDQSFNVINNSGKWYCAIGLAQCLLRLIILFKDFLVVNQSLK
jgi:hypothetical protein